MVKPLESRNQAEVSSAERENKNSEGRENMRFQLRESPQRQWLDKVTKKEKRGPSRGRGRSKSVQATAYAQVWGTENVVRHLCGQGFPWRVEPRPWGHLGLVGEFCFLCKLHWLPPVQNLNHLADLESHGSRTFLKSTVWVPPPLSVTKSQYLDLDWITELNGSFL